MTGSLEMDAQRAFARAARGRRWAALKRWLMRACREQGVLCVVDGYRGCARVGDYPRRGIREIPVDAITATLEPSKASLFDACFRPAKAVRRRWERVWAAEQHGAVLPPISVVPVGDAYAVRDGHHRLSVAIARGALTIDATIDAV